MSHTAKSCLFRSVGLFAVAFWLALPSAGHAQVVTILHDFQGGATDGKNPSGELLFSGSLLYGLTFGGGTAGDGTFFQIGTNGADFSVNHSFVDFPNDGRNPSDSLIQSGSMFYGLCPSGGNAAGGIAFGIMPGGSGFTVLHNFAGGSDGNNPLGSLAQSGSAFYGTTNGGGTTNNGTIFAVNSDGTGYRQLHAFTAGISDGEQPGSGRLVPSGSRLFGMTGGGGTAGLGVVYSVNTDGSGFTVMHSFTGGPGDGWGPAASLILSGTTLFGTTFEGGAHGDGIIFDIQTNGTGFRILHSFTGGPGDGANPTSDLLLVGSMLYGTTARGGPDALGTLFGIGTDGTDYDVLHSFIGGPDDGAGPEQGVILAGSELYGMTTEGGIGNAGTIFSFPIAVPEPSSLLLTGIGSLALLLRRRWIARLVRRLG